MLQSIPRVTPFGKDLEEQPIFAGRGGLGRARKLFGDQLPALIGELNLAVAVGGAAA